MTDNGSCYRSKMFRAACKRLGLRQIFTRPYTPKTNGKAERFIQTALRECAYARTYHNSDQRSAALLHWLHRYNWHWPHGRISDFAKSCETKFSKLFAEGRLPPRTSIDGTSLGPRPALGSQENCCLGISAEPGAASRQRLRRTNDRAEQQSRGLCSWHRCARAALAIPAAAALRCGILCLAFSARFPVLRQPALRPKQHRPRHQRRRARLQLRLPRQRRPHRVARVYPAANPNCALLRSEDR